MLTTACSLRVARGTPVHRRWTALALLGALGAVGAVSPLAELAAQPSRANAAANAAANASANAAAARAPLPPAAWDSVLTHGVPFRNIGPFRGGRSVAVAGVPSQPLTYFAGYTGGGLWRTDNAGGSWRNISDGWFRTGSVGAIAVAPSDEQVLYVGMGEHAIRGQSSTYGDGVYKSTDQGRTFTNVGLTTTRQISAVRVHPANPDVVYVAAQGDRWVGSPDRGIYRTRDGGTTWERVLAGRNATSGASDLSMDPSNPRILYAAFWDHQRTPWYVRSGGEGSGLWKSTNGGDTWTRMSRGLPSLMGKIGVSVSPANPDRVYAIVEADSGGLFRSDDAGATWQRLSGDRLIQTRSWYYMKVIADPKNADVVWVLNAPVLRSIDGGRTFAVVSATHGDNHALWINPNDPRAMINGNDGGASVSLDGGTSWSTQDNQPTSQFYHVTVDDAYPYRLYSGQQDNSSVMIKSRTDGSSIEVRDWAPSAGCESANVGVNAKQPRYVYGGCYQGIIDELDQETGLRRDIMPWPMMNLTERTDSTKYRFNWTAPIVVSQFDPNVIYHAGNVLLRTTDRGTTWAPVSPDLTRNDRTRQGWGGGPITNEGAGGEVYGTIVVLHESSHDARTLLVGTDDGLVQRTTDGGATWTNITPAGVGDGLVNELEVSPHDPNTYYLAFRRDRLGDPTPHVFRSTDAGRSWTRLVNGLRDGEPVRVVREDPNRAGLLYAGTETGLYVSWNAGARWHALSGFPVVPITDLEARHGDLIIATEGRSFWILDDVSVWVQHTDSLRSVASHLYAPRPAVLSSASNPSTTTAGRNAPVGALLHYQLRQTPDSTTTITLEVRDARGNVVRSFSSRSTETASRLPANAGLNGLLWNLRRAAPTTLPGVVLFGAPRGGGAMVPPGTYEVRLTVGDVVHTQPLTVQQDPRVSVPAAIVAERDSIANLLVTRISEMHDAVLRVRDLRTQIKGFQQRTDSAPNATAIAASARTIVGKLDALEPRLTTKASNGQDIINYTNGLNGQFGFLLGQVEGHPGLTQPVRERTREVEALWRALRAEVEAVERDDVAAFNRLLQDGGVQGVISGGKPRAGVVM